MSWPQDVQPQPPKEPYPQPGQALCAPEASPEPPPALPPRRAPVRSVRADSFTQLISASSHSRQSPDIAFTPCACQISEPESQACACEHCCSQACFSHHVWCGNQSRQPRGVAGSGRHIFAQYKPQMAPAWQQLLLVHRAAIQAPLSVLRCPCLQSNSHSGELSKRASHTAIAMSAPHSPSNAPSAPSTPRRMGQCNASRTRLVATTAAADPQDDLTLVAGDFEPPESSVQTGVSKPKTGGTILQVR